MSFKLGDFFPKKQINEPFLALDDPQWTTLEGGYHGSPYDASISLKQLEQATTIAEADTVYKDLWDDLHHQGDIGVASYYAVPHLVRIAKERQLVNWNVLALVTIIETSRNKENPQLPKALTPAYQKAIENLGELALLTTHYDWDLSHTSAALAAIALSKGQTLMAKAILNLDSDSTIEEFLENY